MPTLSIAPVEKRVTVTTIAGRSANGDAEMTISTASLDRESDELVPEGCDLRNYQRNPVVLFGHDHYDLPVGVCTAIAVEPTGIRAAWRWLQHDARAERVRNAYDQGVLRAASVGFMPLAYEPNAHGGVRYTRWELLEWSLVPIPANPDAVRTLKSLGLHGPSAVTHVSVALQQLTAELKAGRVLSIAHEQRLREAATLLNDVLAQVRAEEDDNNVDDGLPTHLLVNGLRVPLTPAMLTAAMTQVVGEAVTAATGRLPDQSVAVYVTEASEAPVVHVSEAELAALITHTVRDALMQVTGRVD